MADFDPSMHIHCCAATTCSSEPDSTKAPPFPKRNATARLRGLLPPRVSSMAKQVERVLENLRRKPHDLERTSS